MIMNEAELKIRYKNRVKFWYKSFQELSTEIEGLSVQRAQLQIKLQNLTKRLDKISNQNTQIIIELAALKQEQTEMSFSDIALK